MAAKIDYRCGKCESELTREECYAKKVSYTTMGMRARILRMRTVAWLCIHCLRKEPEYNMPHKARPYLVDQEDGE